MKGKEQLLKRLTPEQGADYTRRVYQDTQIRASLTPEMKGFIERHRSQSSRRESSERPNS